VTRASLPVDDFIPAIRSALTKHRAAVLTAAPGAGKTTRVAPAMADAGKVILLQPRRVAARSVARRIAAEQQWTIGREVGWHIRFERRATDDTQLLVVTEGMLTAYLQDDPLLTGVSTVIIDEFHERSIHADLGFALAKQAWIARPDLRLLVMSATLDTEPVSRFLAGCPVINVPGTRHPLTIDYAPAQTMADALDHVLPAGNGDVLCFLPGAREIERAMRESAAVSTRHDVDLVPLHGSLDADAQDAAISPGNRRRRVIFATNIAETSLTVPRIAAVIDSGLHKVARYDAGRGVDSLTTERITLDSADQRAGRAARLGPGVARRLWDRRDRLRPHREPEIDRIDLSGPVLSLLAWGADPAHFDWFARPSDEGVAAALELLSRLGAVEAGRVTERGRALQSLPLHPRLGQVLLEGLGSFEAAAACAWLSESGGAEDSAASTSCDLLPVLDRWSRALPHVKRVAEQLERLAAASLASARLAHIDEINLRRALLAGYPDRVAKRRQSGGDRVTLATGHGAVMGRESGVRDGDWLIALDVTAGKTTPHTEAIVRMASRVEPEWLRPTRTDVAHRIESGAVRAYATDWVDALVLVERPVPVDPETSARLLLEDKLSRGPDEATQALLRRARFAGQEVDLRSLVETGLPWDVKQAIDREAPEALTVPSGREMRLEYADDGSVSVSVKLQELFGLAETPLLGRQRVPVTFHLLAPNGRPVQTTRDLKSFWERTYPEVRKELRGRYPRHPWPEDPWTATPTHRTKRR
jgi:ATP-dependent RNA helicase HrpB